MISSRLGTFYNATPGVAKKQQVKNWIWDTYPAAYEALLKHGMYTIQKGHMEDGSEPEEEGMEGLPPQKKESFFRIGHLGRDVEQVELYG